MTKHNLIIKGIAKSWTDEDLNRYIDELMQEIRKDEREQEQKRIIEMFRSLYEKKKIVLKNLGLPLEDWWGESEIFSVNELEDLIQQIQEEKKQ